MAVYMIRAGLAGDVKIGTAKNPVARLKQLQTSISSRLRILRLFEGDRREEALVHAALRASRKTGEWFSFSSDMLEQDFGLTELPVPAFKTSRAYRRADDSANGRRFNLVADLLEEIGGSDVLARAMGIPPWMIQISWSPNSAHYSALVCLARQAGFDIGLRTLFELDEEVQKETFKPDSKVAAKAEQAKAERYWLRNNPRSAMWWTPFTEDNAEASEPIANAESAA